MSDTNLSDDVGPFAHSERVPKPMTLIQESISGNTYVKVNNTTKTNNPLLTYDSDFLTKVYHASHIYILYIFIFVYLVIYILLAFFLKKNGTDNIELVLKRIFDYSIVLILIAIMIYYYYDSGPSSDQNLFSAIWNWGIDWMKDPINLYGIFFFIIVFYIWVFFMHINMSAEHTPYLIKLLEHKLWIILLFFMFFFMIQYFLNIDIYGFFFGNSITNGILNKFSDEQINEKGLIVKSTVKNADIKTNTKTNTGNTIALKGNTQVDYDQVFNIGNNLYSYEDAQHVCSAYGARLANYDEIEDAYNHGAEWCNYGWSDGQMAFFPTQKSTWDGLQKDPKNKNKCGRPGINGGYMNNKFLRFGVNCFGKKPAPKPSDLAMMNKPLPKTSEQAVIDKKVEFWKKNADALLKVNSFNNKQWSEF